MKLIITTLLLIITSVASANDGLKANEFFNVTSTSPVQVSKKKATSLYFAFCSTSSKYHFSNNTSTGGHIDFSTPSDYKARCAKLQQKRFSYSFGTYEVEEQERSH
jgi:restriction endonuclease S subunit